MLKFIAAALLLTECVGTPKAFRAEQPLSDFVIHGAALDAAA